MYTYIIITVRLLIPTCRSCETIMTSINEFKNDLCTNTGLLI